jgi:hypothetical protein
LKLRHAREQLHEHLLRNIRGGSAITRHAERDGVHAIAAYIEETAERFAIARPARGE